MLDEKFQEVPYRVSTFRYIIGVLMGRKVVVFGLIVILLTIIVAIFAPYLAPYDPNELHLDYVLLGPTQKFLLGTDALGRDTLSRIIYGSRISLLIGITAVGLASIIGVTLGLIAGYFGGFIHIFIMRLMDAFMAFPMILLALAITSLLGGGLKNVVIALGIGLTAGYARLMCGQVLTVKENDYLLAERSMGASNMRTMFAHILPNCLAPIMVMMTMMLGACILAEAGLSFLGVGIAPPTATWGGMVNDGYQYLLTLPILSLAPGLAIMIVVFSFNMVGDGLRDALDPRLRGTL